MGWVKEARHHVPPFRDLLTQATGIRTGVAFGATALTEAAKCCTVIISLVRLSILCVSTNSVNVGPWLICQGENVQYPVEMTGRSERKGPLHPQVKEGSSQVL